MMPQSMSLMLLCRVVVFSNCFYTTRLERRWYFAISVFLCGKYQSLNGILKFSIEFSMNIIDSICLGSAKGRYSLEKKNNDQNDMLLAQSRFLANMGHEIRTPMNSILGFIKLVMDDEELPERLRKNLGVAYGSAETLFKLIDNILDLSRLQSGQVKIEEKRFNLFSLVETVSRRYIGSSGNNNNQIIVDIDERMDKYFLGDAQKLEQILLAILDNAVKFTTNGTVEVSVKSCPKPGLISVTVSDTGIGIREDQLHKVFEPFVQVDSSSTRQYSGVGMGVAIVCELVKLMGGEVSVDSTPGIGTNVTFTVQMKPALNNEYAMEKSNMLSKGSLLFRKFKILLVDDIEANLKLSSIHLKREGHEVQTARDGLEAFETYKEFMPDVILMDIHMPIMDGIKATTHIRKLEKNSDFHCIIIAMTASVLKDDLERFTSIGFDYAISKPINFKNLFAVIQDVVPEDMGIAEDVKEKKDTASDSVEDEFSQKDIKTLLGEILEKLDLYNPTEVYPPLTVLGLRLGDDIVRPVMDAVEKYEFDEAVSLIRKIAKQNNIAVE